MNDLFIIWFSKLFNRSANQIKFLLDLCDNSFETYMTLEIKMKHNFIFYCPDDREEINRILNLVDEVNYIELPLNNKKCKR